MRQIRESMGVFVVVGVMAASVSGVVNSSAATPSRVSIATSTSLHTLLNTRTGAGVAPHRRLRGKEHFVVPVAGHAGVPTTRVTAVRLRVAVRSASSSGNVRFLPTGTPSRLALRVRFDRKPAKQMLTVRLGSGGRISIRNSSSGRIHLHVWVAGYRQAPLPDRWTQSGGGPGHGWSNAGAHVTPSSLTKLHPRWTTKRVDDQLVVDGDTVFMSTERPKGLSGEQGIRAASLSTGRTKWTIWGLSIQKRSLAVHGDYLLVGSSSPESAVSAIRISTHRIVWKRTLTTPAEGVCYTEIYALTVDSGVALALSCSGIIDAYDVSTGRHLWSKAGGARLLVAGQRRFAAYTSRGVGVFDVHTGRALWAPALATSVGTLAGSRLTFTSYDTVYSYSITGCGHAVCRPTWTAPTGYGGKVDGEIPNYTASIAATEDTVAVTEHMDLTTRDESRIRLFDGRTGKIIGDLRFAYADIFPHAVLAGSAVLVRYGDHVYAMPTRCHGTCHLRSIYGPDRSDSPTDSMMDTYVIVGRTLIVTPATSRQRTTAYTVG